MRYALLIYANEAGWNTVPASEQQAQLQEYLAFNKEVQAQGIELTANRLQPSRTATTVRIRDGRLVIGDGPYAETKEQLGGYYILNCKDLDEAIEYAKKIPAVRTGAVEVRPIMEI